MKKILDAYLDSLESTKTARDLVHEQYRSELQAQRKKIEDLQDQCDTLQSEKEAAKKAEAEAVRACFEGCR